MFDRAMSWLAAREEPADITTEEEFLQGWRTWAFRILAVLIVAVTGVGLVESFNGLYIWFSTHGVTGFWADFAPIAVDTFSVIGEIAIFVALTGRWHWKKRVLPWVSVLMGFAASVAGNVGRVEAHHPLPWDFTALTFPVAAAFGILIGFSVLKSLAREKAEVALKHRLTLKAETVKVDSMAVSPEGLKEIEEEEYRMPMPPLEAPAPRGVDVLIPPRPVVQAAMSAEPQVEWTGLNPGDRYRERQPDFRRKLSNTGQFPVAE